LSLGGISGIFENAPVPVLPTSSRMGAELYQLQCFDGVTKCPGSDAGVLSHISMKKTCIGSALSLLLMSLLSAASGAGNSSTPGEEVPTFFDMDKDGDGVISAEEGSYWSALAKQWQRIDLNHDGSIDMREWNELDAKALSTEKDP
jgi:hypothetical protein